MLTIFILQTSVQAADKIRISIPGLGGVFMTFPLAYKKGFLKEEGVEAEMIRISSAGGASRATLASGEVDYVVGIAFYSSRGAHRLAGQGRGLPRAGSC